MLALATTGTFLRVVAGTAGTLKCVASWADVVSGAATPGGALVSDITGTSAITVVPAPSSGVRLVGDLEISNTDPAVTTLVTVEQNDGTLTHQRWKGTLLPGQKVLLDETGQWTLLGADGQPYSATARLDARLRVLSDVTNATTSFADITGLTVPLLAGRKYSFEAWIAHSTNATTTGAQFAVNIGATPTSLYAAAQQQLTSPGVATAATYVEGPPITAIDTAFVAETTGPGTTIMQARINGTIIPSADGTFAMRLKSEVAVAGGLVVKAGSWLRIWENDN